jgi:anaerobic ribonucleoside-triphosphate reductase activating protein
VALTGPPAGAGGAEWRVHGVLPRSRVNGPGVRYTIWLQGCSLACPGCFNPGTHAAAGSLAPVAQTVSAVRAEQGIDGVTLTGGEPLQQPSAVAAFCAAVRDLGIVVLTGYSRAEIEADRALAAAVADVDMVIAGRYERRRHLGAGLRGSTNKEYWARTGRYHPDEFATLPETEIVITPDGQLSVTGIAPAPALRRAVAGRAR